MPALAWSESDDDSRVLPVRAGAYAGDETKRRSHGSGYTSARPALNFQPDPWLRRWFHRP